VNRLHISFLLLQELESALEDATRLLDETRSQLSVSERKRIALTTELEDVRTLLESVSCPTSCSIALNTRL